LANEVLFCRVRISCSALITAAVTGQIEFPEVIA